MNAIQREMEHLSYPGGHYDQAFKNQNNFRSPNRNMNLNYYSQFRGMSPRQNLGFMRPDLSMRNYPMNQYNTQGFHPMSRMYGLSRLPVGIGSNNQYNPAMTNFGIRPGMQQRLPNVNMAQHFGQNIGPSVPTGPYNSNYDNRSLDTSMHFRGPSQNFGNEQRSLMNEQYRYLNGIDFQRGNTSNLDNRTDEPSNESQNANESARFSNYQVQTAKPSVETNYEEKNAINSPRSEAELAKKAERYLKVVIVHYIGCDRCSVGAEKDFNIVCANKEEVKANREVLTTASSFFYNNMVSNSNKLILEHMDAHTVKMVVCLISLGRVAVLQSRLTSFMDTIKYFSIPGVFSSEENFDDSFFKEEENEEDLKTHLNNKAGAYELDVKIPIPRTGNLEARVRCAICRNIFLESMFTEHYDHYHAVLSQEEKCCEHPFQTNYDLLQHKKYNCSKRYNQGEVPQTNTTVERPYANAHSTPK